MTHTSARARTATTPCRTIERGPSSTVNESERLGAGTDDSSETAAGRMAQLERSSYEVPATDGAIEKARCVLVESALEVLKRGEIELEGRFTHGSNHTFLGLVEYGGLALHAVYKPRAGERPLWDFTEGTLCTREVAAWRLSEALDWRLVPPTVLAGGPMGEGMLQLYIPHDPEDHYLVMDRPDAVAIDRMVAFDVVINNADRKSGHVLRSADGALWAIDHGVSFHAQPRLRTVIWERAGQPLPAGVAADLHRLRAALSPAETSLVQELAALITMREIRAIALRIDHLLAAGRYPAPSEDRREFPWPPV